jgi:hypothetical protein
LISQLQIYTKYRKGSDGLPPIKTTCAKLLYFSDYDSLRDVRKKSKKKNDRVVNIDKEKYVINSLHVYSCYDFICKEIFVVRLSKNQYKSTVYTHNSYTM